jgi:hypothetical protein
MKEKRERERESAEVERDILATSWLNCILFTILNCIAILSIYREIRSDEQVNLK